MPAPTTDPELARAVLEHQARSITNAADALDAGFTKAVDLITASVNAGGAVLVSGLGKGGLIGAKIAATLSSLGAPAHSVHPTEAAHGDLGRFRKTDVALCLSHSGETEEVVALAATLKQDGLPVIAITRGADPGRTPSALERLADAVIAERVTDEIAPDTGLTYVAPTASTTVALALGDALALAVARRLNIDNEAFSRRHPGGQLGGLLRPVTDLLRFRAGDNLPLIQQTDTVAQALEHAATAVRRPGALLIVDDNGALAGIFTDGDLRRLILRDPAELQRPIADVMTPAPRALPETALAQDAVRLVREHRQDEIPVIDADTRPVGLLDVQDLIALKLVRD